MTGEKKRLGIFSRERDLGFLDKTQAEGIL